MSWSSQSDTDLLRTYASLMSEMRIRGVVRSSNNPVADFTESLIARCLGLQLLNQSASGHDAVDLAGSRYQIKGRRVTAQNSSLQLSAIRNLSARPFDLLAAVVFSEDFSIRYAALIPIEVVAEKGKFSAHTNSHTFHFKPALLDDPRVTVITQKLISG